MSVALYFDVHVRRAVTEGLRLREVDVLTAQEDSAATMDAPVLVDRVLAFPGQEGKRALVPPALAVLSGALGAVGRPLPYGLKTSAYSARGNCSPSGTFIISV